MLNWGNTIIVQNFLLVSLLTLVPAGGRIIQTDGLGEISRYAYWLLEIPVEGTRILLFLLLIGEGDIAKGIKLLSSITTLTKEQWKAIPATIVHNLRLHSIEFLVTTLAFIVAVMALNYMVKYAVQSQGLLSKLQQYTALKHFNSMSLTLFLKNLSVIPLTIFFEVWLILKLLNKI